MTLIRTLMLAASLHIQQGESEPAIQLLKQVYEMPASSEEVRSEVQPEDKFDAAYLLSSFGPGTTAYADRAFYAEYLIASPLSESRLSSAGRVLLLRGMGLGWFSRGQWKQSADAFQDLLKSGSPSDQALAELYLGWIDLNLNRPQIAAQRWLECLGRRERMLAPEWISIILRDLEKVWADTNKIPPLISEEISDWMRDFVIQNPKNLEKVFVAMKDLGRLPVLQLVQEELPFGDSHYSRLIEWMIQNEKDGPIRRLLIEKAYPDPTLLDSGKNNMPFLLWLNILTENSDQKSTIRLLWVNYFLNHFEIHNHLPLTLDSFIHILLQLSEQEQIIWPRPEAHTLADVYLRTLEALVSDTFPGSSVLVFDQESDFLRASKSAFDGKKHFEKARSIQLSLASQKFSTQLQKKFKEIQVGTQGLIHAIALFPALKSTLELTLNRSLSSAQLEIQSIEAPDSWPPEDQETWKGQRSGLADRLNEWRLK